MEWSVWGLRCGKCQLTRWSYHVPPGQWLNLLKEQHLLGSRPWSQHKPSLYREQCSSLKLFKDVCVCVCVCVCVYARARACVLVAQSCPTLCNPMDNSPPGSSVHGILQARILGSHSILQGIFPGDLPNPGIFPTQGSNLGLLHCRHNQDHCLK